MDDEMGEENEGLGTGTEKCRGPRKERYYQQKQ